MFSILHFGHSYRKACVNLLQQLEPLKSREDRDQWLERIIDYVRVSSTNDENIVTNELLSKALKVKLIIISNKLFRY